MPQPSVAALVLNYDGRDLTLAAVASLFAMRYPRFDVVHLDNGSRDGSAEAVAAAFPRTLTVRVEENRGVVAGVNRGFQAALDRGYDYVLLLNNDIEVDPAMLDELVEVAEGDPRIGVVGPKIYYFSARRTLWSAGGVLRFQESITRERGMGEVDRGQYDRDEERPFVSGCASLIRASALREVGLWDPLFHLALDDAEWCTRLRRHGYRCVYAHRAVLWHKVGTTVGGYVARRTRWNARSAALFVRRYASFWQWCTFLAFTAAALPLAFLRELPRGNASAVVAKVRGLIEGLRQPLAPPPRAA